MLIVGLLPALVGCYPYDSNQSASSYDIALTQFSSKANFYPTPTPPPNTTPTYYMPDEVKHLVPPGTTDTIPTTYDSLILSQIAANMTALQYTRIPTSTDITPGNPQPNFVVTVSVTTSTYYGYTYWGGYWGYGCYCYGGYYPYMQPYSFSTGTILIDMADQSQVDPVGQTATIIWGCGINGLMYAGSTSSRITNQINQCFSQSPYLGP
jgi:hypothetical protein